MQLSHGIVLDPPEGFVAEESMVSFRAPVASQLTDPRMMQKQMPIRPNLIVHTRKVRDGQKLQDLVAEATAELMRSVPGLINLASSQLPFADAAVGTLLMFDFSAGDASTVRQYHALRLDGGMLTTLTMTVNALGLTESMQANHVALLASAKKV